MGPSRLVAPGAGHLSRKEDRHPLPCAREGAGQRCTMGGLWRAGSCLLAISASGCFLLTALLLAWSSCGRLVSSVVGLKVWVKGPGCTPMAVSGSGRLWSWLCRGFSWVGVLAGTLRQAGVRAECWHGIQAGWACKTSKHPLVWHRALLLGAIHVGRGGWYPRKCGHGFPPADTQYSPRLSVEQPGMACPLLADGCWSGYGNSGPRGR